jgi:hypothetical protein
VGVSKSLKTQRLKASEPRGEAPEKVDSVESSPPKSETSLGDLHTMMTMWHERTTFILYNFSFRHGVPAWICELFIILVLTSSQLGVKGKCQNGDSQRYQWVTAVTAQC